MIKKNLKAAIFVGLMLRMSVMAHGQIVPLKVGDKTPVQLAKHIQELISRSACKNNINKPVLIDFWATWCAPCVAALKPIDSLQTFYKNKLTVLSVLEKEDSRVPEVLKRVFGDNGSKLTFIEKDAILSQYFPHRTIPHYVWIDQHGNIKTISADEKAISSNIDALLNDSPSLNIKQKTPTVSYNGTQPLYASKQANLKDELLYHSMISKWRPEFSTESARGDNFINCLNSSRLWLFQIAFGKFNLQYLDMNRVVLEGFTSKADSARIGIFSTDTLKKLWRRSREENLFSYELMVPDSVYSYDQLFEIMQQDINRYFLAEGLNGHLENRSMMVYELCYLDQDQSEAFKSTDEKPGHYATPTSLKMINQPVSFFLSGLMPYLKKRGIPLLNGTGYNNVINIDITNTANIETINKSLTKYGLVLLEHQKSLDVLVLKKSSKN